MDYKEGIEKLFPLVEEVWKKVESGFFPEIDQEIKLEMAKEKIRERKFEEGFWALYNLLVADLIPMGSQDLSKEKREIGKILEDLKIKKK